eukprot:Seg658.1 transcript_id=Seg658.1/GoldUCD/mRNA.D3Y31 product="Protein MB21D2" protein_id=Seg658.1/GoldUCD/D3Y31
MTSSILGNMNMASQHRLEETFPNQKSKVKELNEHFRYMVTSDNGMSLVNTEDDIYQPKLVELIISKVLGTKARRFIKVSGSAAQNLKCISKTNQGDADVVFIANFPNIKTEEQKSTFIPLEDPGFYQIKRIQAWDKYPVVERNGILVLNAASLRHFEHVWCHEEMKIPLLVMGVVLKEFKKAEEGVASVLRWRSTGRKHFESLNNGFILDHAQFFSVLTRSYKEHVVPILKTKQHVETMVRHLSKIEEMAAHYGGANAKHGYEALQQLEGGFEDGLITVLLEYCRKKFDARELFIEEDTVPLLMKLHDLFENAAIEEVSRHDEAISNIALEHVDGTLDMVPAISCNGFPDVAKDWPSRVGRRAWPADHVVDAVLKAGFEIVPKASKARNSDPTTSFRLSFNDAEQLLALSVTQFQRECFRAFKMYFYEKMDQEPQIVETYHLKTIFFWCLEESDADIWVMENRAYCCLLLLRSLALALEKMTLQHYFIPGCNLFKYMDREGAVEMKRRIDQIIQDPVAACGPIIQEIRTFYIRRFDEASKVVVSSEGLNSFFNRSTELFEKLISSLSNGESKAECNLSESLQKSMTELLDNKSIKSLMRFSFDLVLARNYEARMHKNFSRQAPLPAPLASFILMLLPAADELVKKVFLPNVKGSERLQKKIRGIEYLVQTAVLLPKQALIGVLQMVKTVEGIIDNTPIHSAEQLKIFEDEELD